MVLCVPMKIKGKEGNEKEKSMSDNNIGKVGINTVSADSWGTGNRNDCWWNIAKNQLGESASAQEVQALVNELQAYNEEKNASIVRQNDVICEGDQIFIPLEYAMDEIQANVQTKTQECSKAQETLQTASANLSTANANVNSALGDLNSAQAAYDTACGQTGEDGKPVDTSEQANNLAAAKEAYLQALSEQQQAQSEVDTANEALTTIQEELTSYQQELTDIQTEYQDEQSEYEQELSEIQTQLETINNNIDTTQTELEQAKASQEAAAEQQESATAIGVKTETKEDGTVEYTLDGDIDSEKLAEAAQESQATASKLEAIQDKEVSESSIIDGGRTKRVEYEDGTVAEFSKDEDGNWKAVPGTVYGADGKIIMGDTTVQEAGSTTDYTTFVQNIAQESGADIGAQKINELIENGEYDELINLAETYSEVIGDDTLLGAYQYNTELLSSMVSSLEDAYNNASSDERREEIAQLLSNELNVSLTGDNGSKANVLNSILNEEGGISDDLLEHVVNAYNSTAESNGQNDLYTALIQASANNHAERILTQFSYTDTDMAATYISGVESSNSGNTETEKLKEYFGQFDDSSITNETGNYMMNNIVGEDCEMQSILESVDASMTPDEAKALLVKLYARYGNSNDSVIEQIRTVHSSKNNKTEELYMQNYARLWVIANQAE